MSANEEAMCVSRKNKLHSSSTETHRMVNGWGRKAKSDLVFVWHL